MLPTVTLVLPIAQLRFTDYNTRVTDRYTHANILPSSSAECTMPLTRRQVNAATEVLH